MSGPKDGELCLRRANICWRLVVILKCKSFVILGYRAKYGSNHLAVCFFRIAEDEQLYQVR